MPTIKFANILLEQNPRSLSYPSLYCKSTNSLVPTENKNTWKLYGAGIYDFTTYFNGLSVAKLRKYAAVSSFSLHLELQGASCTVSLTYGDAFSSNPKIIDGTKIEVASTDNWQTFDFNIQAPKNAILVGFVIETTGAVLLRNGYYSVEVPHNLNNIELVLSTTTFKKEDYIKRNIKLVENEILSSDELIASHFRMQVIDNGRTLNPELSNSDKISIFPSDNVGGAGGFTRGMIEAMSHKETTHILLMDDDVAVSPESIKRTYNLLSIVNDEYKDAFISGAMLNYEVGEEQWEDVGYMTPQGTFSAVKPQLHLARFEDVIYNESFEIPKTIRELNQSYAAWWYCCIPISTIKEKGLPLPVFVRCDDAEYGVRCQPKFITMNGLCIWHMAFHSRYNAAVERYQTTRNTLIARFTTGFAPNSDFMHELKNNVRLELKKFGYENAELVLDAFEDFLKGPEFIMERGVAEKTFMTANKNKEKLVPFDELEKQAHSLGLVDFDISKIDRQFIDSDKKRSFSQRVSDFLTDNGQKHFTTEGSGYAVIPAVGWAYPAGVIRGKKYLVVIDWHNRVGAVRTKDTQRYKAIVKRYKTDLRTLKNNEVALRAAYSACRDEITSMDYWKKYLGVQ